MANFKRKGNYKKSRSCGLCKPWKRIGNSKKMEKPKYKLWNHNSTARVASS